MIEVLLSLDPRTGNDPLEASTPFPECPRVGEQVEVWVKYEEVGDRHRSGPEFLEVEQVTWSTYAPGRVVVSVRADTYDYDEVERIFRAIQEDHQP